MTTNSHDSTTRARRFAQHVLDLAQAFNVRVRVVKRMAPHEAGAGVWETLDGATQGRFIMIVPVTDETTYAVALHELGHCCSALGMLQHHGSPHWRKTNQCATVRDVRLLLEEEAAAWEWARHYALEWTDLMTHTERIGLESYERHLGDIARKDTL